MFRKKNEPQSECGWTCPSCRVAKCVMEAERADDWQERLKKTGMFFSGITWGVALYADNFVALLVNAMTAVGFFLASWWFLQARDNHVKAGMAIRDAELEKMRQAMVADLRPSPIAGGNSPPLHPVATGNAPPAPPVATGNP
jgi:hypothetical protein